MAEKNVLDMASWRRRPTCGDGCRSKADLRKSHGTPEEFGLSLVKAFASLMITGEEMDAAMEKYQQEWDRAPDG